MFDTFLVAVYVYDDDMKIVFSFSGRKNTVSVPLDASLVDGIENNAEGKVRIGTLLSHHNQKVRTRVRVQPFKSAVSRYIEAPSVSYSTHRGTMPNSATQIVPLPMQPFKMDRGHQFKNVGRGGARL